MKTKILYTVIFWHITPLDAFELASPCAQITLFGPTPGQFAGSEVYMKGVPRNFASTARNQTMTTTF